MEESITLEELYTLHDALFRAEHRRNQFMAAIQGIDIDEGNTDSRFEEINMKAQADLAGQSEEEFVFDLIGINIETDD